jgi:TrmH family RNA methyltransferase
LFTSLDKSIPVYGTYLDGQDIYSTEITPNGIIVMGNEGNGITREVSEYINQRLYLPNYPKGVETSESLNVAVATAITCAEFRRRMS